MEIDHKDADPTNNRLDNLSLVSRQENLKKMKCNKDGIYSSQAVAQYDLDDNLICIYSSVKKAAVANNCRRNHIIDCCKGFLKTYKKYKWKYYNEDNENDL